MGGRPEQARDKSCESYRPEVPEARSVQEGKNEKEVKGSTEWRERCKLSQTRETVAGTQKLDL